MGLSICLLKAQPLGDKNPDSIDNYVKLIEYPELIPFFGNISFKKNEEEYDFDYEFNKLGYEESDLQFIRQNYKTEGDINSIFFEFKNPRNEIIEIINPKLTIKTYEVIAYKEISYQSKGANKKFYDACDVAIVTENQLLFYWNNYFSGNDYHEEERIVLFEKGNMIDKNEYREDFKRNIVNKFREGETFVCFW